MENNIINIMVWACAQNDVESLSDKARGHLYTMRRAEREFHEHELALEREKLYKQFEDSKAVPAPVKKRKRA